MALIDRSLPPGKPEMQLADQQGLIVVDQIQEIVRRHAGTGNVMVHGKTPWRSKRAEAASCVRVTAALAPYSVRVVKQDEM